MTDLTFSEQNSFLHHGIEGQKWGVRNGPPYPLDRGSSQGSKNIDNDNNQKDGILSELIAYSAVAALTTAIIGISAAHESHVQKKVDDARDNFEKQGKQASEISKAIKSGKAIPSQYKKEGDPLKISKEELKSINEGFSYHSKGRINGRQENCTRCATTFILHKKGYNVKAAAKYEGDFTQDIMKDCFNCSPKDFGTRSEASRFLKDSKEGSYGAISFRYETSYSGHVLNWAKENGEVVIYDAQPGTKMSWSQFNSKYGPSYTQKIKIYDATSSKIYWDEVAKREITV